MIEPVSHGEAFFELIYINLTVACSKTSFILTRRKRCRTKTDKGMMTMKFKLIAIVGIAAAAIAALGLAAAGFDLFSIGTLRIPGLEPHIFAGIEALRIPGLEPHIFAGIESFRIPGLEPH